MSVLKIRNDADTEWIDIGGTQVAANWELVESLYHETGSLDWTITGLAGDTDKRYTLVVEFYEDLGSASAMYWRMNGDTGATYGNLAHEFGHSHGSSKSSGDTSSLILSIGANEEINGKVEFFADSQYGGRKTSLATLTRYLSNTWGWHSNGFWTNTTDEVTSITFLTNNSVECKLSLYRWVDVEDGSIANSTTHNCVVYVTREAAQTINNVTATKIIHDNIHIDRGGHYDTDDNRVIATQKGVYSVDASVTYNSIGGGVGFDCQINVNGTKVSWHRNQIDFTGTGSQTTFWLGELDVGEYVEHFVEHGHGSSRTTKDPFIGGTSMRVELLYTTT